ncbi:MAG TPA: nuclear transport factor 2 family protein [Acidimicrobiales bacterium]|nr:nuclear transport factor 2 family protein [Acidimicrobiales bacterium]
MSDPDIAGTIERYQSTFSADDRDGWLALFTDDAVLEDPVGSAPHEGRAAIAAFWDAVHARTERGTVRMTQGPAVCGLEAAWAFELDVTVKGRRSLVGIIDHGTFAADGRIRRIRAFWSPATVRPG